MKHSVVEPRHTHELPRGEADSRDRPPTMTHRGEKYPGFFLWGPGPSSSEQHSTSSFPFCLWARPAHKGENTRAPGSTHPPPTPQPTHPPTTFSFSTQDAARVDRRERLFRPTQPARSTKQI